MKRLLLIAVLTGFLAISLAEIEGALGVVPLPNWLAGIDGAIGSAMAYWFVCSEEFRRAARDPWWSAALLFGVLLGPVSHEVGSYFPAASDPINWIGKTVMFVAFIGLLYRGRTGGAVTHGHSPASPTMLMKGDLRP